MKQKKNLLSQSLRILPVVAGLCLSGQAMAAVKLSLSGQSGSIYGSIPNERFSVRADSNRSWNWTDPRQLSRTNAFDSLNSEKNARESGSGFNIQLAGAGSRVSKEIKREGSPWHSNAFRQGFPGLAQGGSPFSAITQGSSSSWNQTWKNLNVTLDHGNGGSSSNEQGENGFNMPNMGHPLVAELHYDGNNGLTFEAWYKNPTTNVWIDVASADTSSGGGNTPQSSVPEPVSLFIMLLGLVTLLSNRKFQKQSLYTRYPFTGTTS